MKDIVKLAYLFDKTGNYILADKLDKIARNNGRVILADQGVYNPVFQGVNLKDELTKLVRESTKLENGKNVIDIELLSQKIQSGVLRYFISKVQLETNPANAGSFFPITKILKIDPTENIDRTIANINTTFRHEAMHGTSPIQAKYRQKYNEYLNKLLPIDEQIRALEEQKTLSRIEIFGDGGYKKVDYSSPEYLAYSAKYDDLEAQLMALYEQKSKIKVNFNPNMNTRGRIPYFKNEEVMTQTENFKSAFNKVNLNAVYEKFYAPDLKKFQVDMEQFLASFAKTEAVMTALNNQEAIYKQDFMILNNVRTELPDYFNSYIDYKFKMLDSNIELSEDVKKEIKRIEDLATDKFLTKLLKNAIPSLSFAEKVEAVSGEPIIHIMKNIKDPVWFSNIRKSISNDVIEIEQDLGLRPRHEPLRSEILEMQNKTPKDNVFLPDEDSVDPYIHQIYRQEKTPSLPTVPEVQTKPKPKPKPSNAPKKTNQPRSTQISRLTSRIPQNKFKFTPKSKSALSAILPTIKKLFKELVVILEKNLSKFNNSPVGKVVNFAMLVKDIYFIVTLTDKISKQIDAGEDVMIKDQYDLGLTIVSLLTDQQTQAALRVIFPPIIPVLNNPQFQAWLVSINIGASVLSGLVTATDYLGKLVNTSNKSEGATSGVLNTPGSLQALVMPVFDLRDKYGEVYNALIDVEKGIPVPQAISKHIMKDASGGLEPYRLSLFYKFRENKPRILQYQKSAEFKKLPAQNQLLYPSANSAYAISSYKKARDAQARARQEAYDRNFAGSSGLVGPGGRSIPQQ